MNNAKVVGIWILRLFEVAVWILIWCYTDTTAQRSRVNETCIHGVILSQLVRRCVWIFIADFQANYTNNNRIEVSTSSIYISIEIYAFKYCLVSLPSSWFGWFWFDSRIYDLKFIQCQSNWVILKIWFLICFQTIWVCVKFDLFSNYSS